MSAADEDPAAAPRAVLVAGDHPMGEALARWLADAAIRLVADHESADSIVCCVKARPGIFQPLADVDPAEFKADISGSLRAAFSVSRQVLPALVVRRGSLVYCVASDDEICLQAIQTLMRSLVYQYGPQGVRANLVRVGDDLQAAAALVRFLVSGDASFMNGATL